MFVKLDCSIVFKSIWAEDSDTCKVWITMLAMADSDGLLSAAVTGISSVSKVSIENTQKAIDIFLAPDKLSTNPDHEGRRIERVSEGYKILNYEVYRQKDHTAAARMRKHRDMLRVTGVTLQPVYVSDSVIILNYLNLKTNRKYRNTKEILARLAAGHKVDEFKKIIDTKTVDPFFVENPQHLNPVTLFRKSHFDTYLNQRPEDFKGNGKNKQPSFYDGHVFVESKPKKSSTAWGGIQPNESRPEPELTESQENERAIARLKIKISEWEKHEKEGNLDERSLMQLNGWRKELAGQTEAQDEKTKS